MTCGIEMKMATIWLALILLNSGVAAIHIFLTPGSLPATIPASCRASLAADITCGPRLIHASELENDFPFNATFLSEYCNSTCTTSLNTFAANINTRCGNVDYDFGYNTTQSGNDIAVALKWAHDTACLTGLSAMGTGFCLPGVVNHTAQVCDDCTLKYLAGMLSSEFGARKITPSGYSSLLSSCAVAPTRYPYTTPSSVALPTMTPMPNQTCFGGTYYTIKGGDGCESIAAANNLAIDNFLALNSIDPNCTAIAQGMTVCIRDSCKLYTVQPGDTCKSILAAHSFTMNELVAWNPVLETNCDDMATMVGRSICIS
ncbi:hypothetical protein F4825DRAFT_421529 [Nemania diffusa]|nr:hypothetical protein F4825DRAFT_421529 [Nemania diffusa]